MSETLREEETWEKEVGAAQAHKQLPCVKLGGAGLRFMNVNRAISSCVTSQKGISRRLLRISVRRPIPTGWRSNPRMLGTFAARF
jgi:hypothetical protein